VTQPVVVQVFHFEGIAAFLHSDGPPSAAALQNGYDVSGRVGA